ncbi:hypothetical protein [Caudoviricetes sp.]|nr:hypothetical protein [Caudoviricetes sp.]
MYKNSYIYYYLSLLSGISAASTLGKRVPRYLRQNQNQLETLEIFQKVKHRQNGK